MDAKESHLRPIIDGAPLYAARPDLDIIRLIDLCDLDEAGYALAALDQAGVPVSAQRAIEMLVRVHVHVHVNIDERG